MSAIIIPADRKRNAKYIVLMESKGVFLRLYYTLDIWIADEDRWAISIKLPQYVRKIMEDVSHLSIKQINEKLKKEYNKE